jgi:hypothetical protein
VTAPNEPESATEKSLTTSRCDRAHDFNGLFGHHGDPRCDGHDTKAFRSDLPTLLRCQRRCAGHASMPIKQPSSVRPQEPSSSAEHRQAHG